LRTSLYEEAIWCDKHVASKILGLSTHGVKKLRTTGVLIEGVHWVRYGTHCIRYNCELLRDFVATRHEPQSHDRAIAQYLTGLPSNQPKRAGRPAKAPANIV